MSSKERGLLDIVKLSAGYLASKGIQEPRREAEWVIADALGIPRIQLYLDFDRPLNDEEILKLRHRIKRRGEKEPSAYIKGEVEFYGCHLKLTPEVLIPRPETEILVDEIAKVLEGISGGLSLTGKKLLDLCTGSGCVALSLKKHFDALEVYATDISESALAVAKENATSNHLDVQFFQGDLFQPIRGEKFDYITCNPPYVSEKEYEELDLEVRLFEPSLALLAGPSGLEFYERLAELLPTYLMPEGRAWLEIGASQGPSVLELFSAKCWKRRQLGKDWARQDRFISLEME